MRAHRLGTLGFGCLLGLLAVTGVVRATAGEPTTAYEATLVWGTNDPLPEDSKLQPVEPAVARKLAKLPFKWKHYYAVEQKEFHVVEGKQTKVVMSDECEILVKSMKEDRVELTLRGKGQVVGKVTQKLAGNQMLVTGGNAENLTAWFVVLRRAPDEPR